MACPECHHRPSGRFDANGYQCHCKCHDKADSAPELLEACYKARAFLAGSIAEEDQPIIESALREAIAKATGN